MDPDYAGNFGMPSAFGWEASFFVPEAAEGAVRGGCGLPSGVRAAAYAVIPAAAPMAVRAVPGRKSRRGFPPVRMIPGVSGRLRFRIGAGVCSGLLCSRERAERGIFERFPALRQEYGARGPSYLKKIEEISL